MCSSQSSTCPCKPRPPFQKGGPKAIMKCNLFYFYFPCPKFPLSPIRRQYLNSNHLCHLRLCNQAEQLSKKKKKDAPLSEKGEGVAQLAGQKGSVSSADPSPRGAGGGGSMWNHRDRFPQVPPKRRGRQDKNTFLPPNL